MNPALVKRINARAYCALLGCTMPDLIAYAADGSLKERLHQAAVDHQNKEVGA